MSVHPAYPSVPGKGQHYTFGMWTSKLQINPSPVTSVGTHSSLESLAGGQGGLDFMALFMDFMVVGIELIFWKDRRMCREVKWHGSNYRASGKKRV